MAADGAFSIELEPDQPGRDEGWGRITLGDFVERFQVPLHYWTRADYEAQWRDAVRHTVNGERRTALIAAMGDPNEVNFIVWWPMYRDGETVFVQNHLLFLRDAGYDVAYIDSEFDVSHPYVHVRERQVESDEGPISEWVVAVSDLRRWLGASTP